MKTVARHVSYFEIEHFEELIYRVIHWAQSLHGEWKKQLCCGTVRVLLTFPGGSHLCHLSLFASCGSVVRLLWCWHLEPTASLTPWDLSAYKTDSFFCGRDACWYQGTCHQVVQVLMSGYPASSLFVDEAKSINGCSAAEVWGALKWKPRQNATASRTTSLSNMSPRDAMESATVRGGHC